MISKIFNWTMGGFFRTIGRTLAFIAIGALIAWLLSKTGFDVKSLFLEKVKADSYGNALVTFTNCDTGSCTMLIGAPTIYGVTDTISGQTVSRITKFHTWNMSANVPEKANSIDFLFLGRSQFNNGLDLNISAYISTNKGQTWCNSITYSGNEGFYTISCPITSGTTIINQIAITTVWNFEVATAGQLQQGLSPLINYSYDGTQAIIDNQNQNTQEVINATEQQTQQQQQQHQEMMDTNSTNTDNKANSFFNSFDSNETYGGLSSIVTAPLVVVNQMLSNTCVAPSATWKGATITLPCGDMFWSRPGASDLKNLLNVFYGGFICYYAIRKLFLMIENLKDPTHDKIEVMDL